MCMVREEILVYGDIQAVGFRPYIKGLAERHGIVGLVENLHLRPVSIICEGEEETIDSFLNQIPERLPEHINIENIRVLTKNPIEKLSFKSFKIVKEKTTTLDDVDERLQTAAKVLMSIDSKMGKLDNIESKLDVIESKLDKLDNIESKLDKIADGQEKGFKSLVKILEKIYDKL